MGSRNNKPGRIVKGTALQPSLKSASGVWSLDEAMQAHRANAWPQPNLFQPVGNSLRNSLGKTGYISRESPGRSGSQRKFTFSWWLKKNSNATSSQQHLFYSYDGSRLLQIFFERGGNTNPDCICVYGGGTDLRFTPVLRDVSAWYNIVIAVDIDQSTSANTIKCWINGVQITAVGTQGGSPGTPSYPTSATNWPINQAGVYQRIGGNAGGGTMDGQFAEINFIDGAQLPPTLFGQFDTNNTWVPVAYTGAYGTNGFYLPFNNAATSQTLGYDASLNGTTTYDADQDPYRGHVALHLTGNGPAGGNNNVFADSSSTNNAISRTGNVTQGSFSPYPLPTNAPYNPAINGASAYFPKSGWLSAPTAAVSSLGTGDFTFESWVYPLDFTTTTLFQRWFSFGTGLASDVTVNIDTSGNLVFRINDATQLTSATSLTANAWNHVAFVRSSGTVRFYINGYSGNSASVATNISTQGGNPIIIGAEPGQSQGSAGDFFGYMSNFRIIKGVAVYTANFTPTMRPFGTLTNNLLTFSEEFSNSYWTAQSQGVSFTPSAAIAPDGTPSATLIVPSTSSATQNIAGLHDSSAGVNTFSIYAKSAGYRYVQCLHSRSAGGDSGYVTFDLTTGTVTNSNVWSGSVVNVGNGWYRLIATTSSLSGASANSNVRWAITDGSASRGIAFTGNGTSGIYVWGAQAELASSVGEYTPTPANFRTAPSLLLNFANAAVVDSSGANNLVTVSNATITSASKYGSGALTFNGTSDYLNGRYIPPIGTGDFTVETWCRLPNVTPTSCWRAMITLGAYSASGGLSLFAPRESAPANTAVAILNTVNPTISGITNVNDNQWHHVALVRNRTRLSLYVDGREDSTTSNNDNITQTILYVGADPGCGAGAVIGASGQTYYQGALEDIRITVGLARYTSAFTPPARALPEVGGKSFITTNVNAGVVQRFTTTGTTSWTAPSDVTQVEVLVVAGGGAGGNNHAGGGGAGGLVYNNSYPVTPGQTYTVTVGAGGLASGTGANNNTNGGNSQFGALTAIGGGAGGNRNDTAGTSPGQNGGSGGGGGGAQAPFAGCYVAGLGTAGQGFSGGVAVDTLGGGGGGAGGVGAAGVGTRVGGNGLQFGVSGTPQYYAGGGGGSNGSAPAAAGGLGGGGTSGTTIGSNGTAGTANTGGGGGGGGAGNTTGSNGGSGIVIVRYTTTTVGNTSDATTDNLVDSPTLYGHDTGAGGEVVGNYCTLNPLNKNSGVTVTNGNLTFTGASVNQGITGTIGVSSGKWYYEASLVTISGTAPMLGFVISQGWDLGYVGNFGGGYAYEAGGSRYTNGGSSAYSGASSYTVGDIIGVALDLTAGTLSYYKNGVSQGVAFSGLSGTFLPALSAQTNTWNVNFGQRAWAYAPPAGFNAITTKNLPRLAIGSAAATPNQYFDVATWTQGATDVTLTNAGGFQPDFVWIKSRSNSQNHYLMDSVRGTTGLLRSNGTGAESTGSTWITFNSNGFTPSSTNTVTNTYTYVGWQWKAGGAAVSNTAGTITSSVSANTVSGFSIVTYTGGATGATVGHGLGVTPAVVITKCRNATQYWIVHHQDIAITSNLYLQSTDPAQPDGQYTAKSATTLTLGASNSSVNTTGNTYVSYCWAEVAGFSKFGSYTGNGSADGIFVYTGFKPAFLLAKRYDAGSSENWFIVDSSRNTFNPANSWLSPSLVNNEGNDVIADLLSTGFKLRSTAINANAGTYIYMAFAEKPFGNVNGVAR